MTHNVNLLVSYQSARIKVRDRAKISHSLCISLYSGSLPWCFTGLHFQLEVHGNQTEQGFCTVDIGYVFSGCWVGLCRKNNDFLPFGHEITYGELYMGTDASICLQNPESFAIFSFDIFLQLPPSNR